MDDQNQYQAQPESNPQPQDQVTNAQEPVRIQPTTNIPKKSNLKKILIILLAIIMLALSVFAVFGAYYLGINMNKTALVKNELTNTSNDDSQTNGLRTFSNIDLSFKYPKEYVLSDNMIKINNSNIQIDIIESSAAIGGLNCAEITSTENINKAYMINYSYVKDQEDCENVNSNQRQIWIVSAPDSISPAIVVSFTATDETKANQIVNQLISTIIFNK